MGREIRKVPKTWEHPKKTDGGYQPLYDDSFNECAEEWLQNCILWSSKDHPEQQGEDPADYQYFWEWEGDPPDREYYRPEWTDEERTCIQMYETVSEGTPVSPVFETPEELVDYLVEHGDYWDQSRGHGGRSRESAEAFVKSGWAPSFAITGGVIKSNIGALP